MGAMEAVPEMNNKVVRTAELETTKDDQVSLTGAPFSVSCQMLSNLNLSCVLQGRKILNGKYLVDKTLASNTLCKLKVASLVEDPNKKVCLKIWKK